MGDWMANTLKAGNIINSAMRNLIGNWREENEETIFQYTVNNDWIPD
jgi:hypothetical protein